MNHDFELKMISNQGHFSFLYLPNSKSTTDQYGGKMILPYKTIAILTLHKSILAEEM